MSHIGLDLTLENDVVSPEMSSIRSFSLGLASARSAPDVADFGVGRGRVLLQDKDNHCLLDQAPLEHPRATGYCGLPGTNLAVSVRDFWQRYPKGFRLEDGVLHIDLLPELPENSYTSEADKKLYDRLYTWCHRGRYTFRTGVRITTSLALHCHLGENGAKAAAMRFQYPLRAMVTPEHACASGVFGKLVPRRKGCFTRYEANVDKAFQGFLRRRETMREYGFMNYGDWYGERSWNWGNIEYDTQHALALNALRTGNPAMLIRAEQAEAHNADVDTIHYASQPVRIGQAYTHCIGHTGGYVPPGFKGMASPFTRGTCSPSHTWCRGHFLLWALTGNERYRETGEQTAAFLATRVPLNPQIGFSRSGGWTLIGLTGAYQMTSDPFYLDAARVMTTKILDKQRRNGQWGHLIWEARDEVPRPWGCKPFMTGIIMHGLSMMDRIEPNPDIKDALVRGARYLWDYTYLPRDHGFIYAEAPKFRNRGGTWTLVLNGDGLARAANIAPDKATNALLLDALRYNMYTSGIGSFGKTFTQGLCFMPYMLAELTELGITNPPPPETASPATILLRSGLALEPGRQVAIHPACLNESDQTFRCSLSVPWSGRRFVVGERRLSWEGTPGFTLGPPLQLALPSEEGKWVLPLRLTTGDGKRRDFALHLETVSPAPPATKTAWITGQGDHFAAAARTLGLTVTPIKEVQTANLAEIGTLFVGTEALNKDFAGCRSQTDRLRHFVARGGTLVVAQLNDDAWDPSFLPFDLYLNDDNTATAPPTVPDHPLFRGIDPAALQGIVCYDTICFAAEEWTVLMKDVRGNPAILEARAGAGRVLVVMPSFDRVVLSAGPQEKACRQFLNHLFRYAGRHN